MSALHDDVIYEILSFHNEFKFVIMTCALVSKQWFHVIKSNCHHLSLEYNGKNNSKEMDGQFLQNISNLNVKSCIDFCKKLIWMKSLTKLCISNCKIIDVQAEQISKLKLLKSFEFTANQISSEGLKYIAQLEQLTDLNISNNTIGPVGETEIGELKPSPNFFFPNKIGDKGITSFNEMNQLIKLNISDNSMSHEGAKHVSKFSQISDLNISSNKIGPIGAKYISEMKKLTNLEIPNCGIGVEGVKYISEMEGEKPGTGTHMKKPVPNFGLQIRTEIRNAVFSLRFQVFPPTSEMFQLTLTRLDISDNNIGDEGAKHLSKLNQLTNLHISDNQLGGEGAKYISTMNQLTSLNISCNMVGVEGAKHISKLNKLTNLDIFMNEICCEGAKYLSEMDQLTSLQISDNTIGDEGGNYLCGMKQLKYISIYDTSISQELFDKLNHLFLEIDHCIC